MLPREEKGKTWGVTANDYKVSFWGDGNVLELDTVDGCVSLWIYQNPLNGTF